MKRWLILGVVVLALGGAAFAGIFYLVFQLVSPVVEAADQFLALVGDNKLKEAYQSTAEPFRQSLTEGAFVKEMQKRKLTEYASSTWTQRQVRNQMGGVKGSITTKAGERVPLEMNFIQEDGVWKVQGIR